MNPVLWRIPHVPELAYLACVLIGATALYQCVRAWKTQGPAALAGMIFPVVFIALIVKFAILDRRFETVPIYAYGVCIMLGFIFAISLATQRAKRAGADPNLILDMGIMAVVAGIAGSRINHVIQFWELEYAGRPWYRPLEIYRGGMVFYGGLILAAAGCIWLLRRRGASLWRVADICVPAVPIGLAVGRIGCFMNGCCWGARCATDYALAVQFPHDSPAWRHHVEQQPLFDPAAWKAVMKELGDGADWWSYARDSGALDAALTAHPTLNQLSLPVHPTQLYASAAALALSLFLMWFYRYRRGEGEMLWLMGSVYAGQRYLLELIRGDTHSHPMFFGFTMSQFIALICVACVPIWLGFRYFGRPVAAAGPAAGSPASSPPSAEARVPHAT